MGALKQEDRKTELLFQWVQNLVMENVSNGVLSVPAPILQTALAEVAGGMTLFHKALKISLVPFPFPYAQMCHCLLCLHWLMVPMVVVPWVSQPAWAGIYSFVQVFILWGLNSIAVELEQPYGVDANDLNGRLMQRQFNERVVLLLRPHAMRTPRLKANAIQFHDWDDVDVCSEDIVNKQSFSDVFRAIDAAEQKPLRSKRRSRLMTGGDLLASGSICQSSFELTIETLTQKSHAEIVGKGAEPAEEGRCASDRQEALLTPQCEDSLPGDAIASTLASKTYPRECDGTKSLGSSSSHASSFGHDPGGEEFYWPSTRRGEEPFIPDTRPNRIGAYGSSVL